MNFTKKWKRKNASQNRSPYPLDYKEAYLKFLEQGNDVVHITLGSNFRAPTKMLCGSQ